MPEQLLRSTPDAPWLPPGGRADVVRADDLASGVLADRHWWPLVAWPHV